MGWTPGWPRHPRPTTAQGLGTIHTAVAFRITWAGTLREHVIAASANGTGARGREDRLEASRRAISPLSDLGRTCTAGLVLAARARRRCVPPPPVVSLHRTFAVFAACVCIAARYPIAGRLSSQHVRGPRLPVLLATSRPPRVGCPRAQCVPPPPVTSRVSPVLRPRRRLRAQTITSCLSCSRARVLLTSVPREGFR